MVLGLTSPGNLLTKCIALFKNDGRKISKSASSRGTWFLLATGAGILIVTSLVLMVYILIKRKRQQKFHLIKPHQFKQIPAPNPAPIPVSYSSTVQQPVVFGSLDETIPSSCSPVDPRTQKIKLRSLLERRGSNTSLTLDLNSAESLDMRSPPSESSTLEYLSSTGKRLTRRQLRSYGNNPKKLDQEFADIPLHYAAKLDIPGASYKNRYNSIWPNKETRVVLRNSCSSDGYINANYIRGRNGNPRTFVATQGPMPNTVDDVWALVWQEKCPVIVMMTKLKEKNVVKCEPYFPNYEARYGDIRVFVHKKVMKNGYCVRDIELVKGDSSHTLRHYWFTVWPDHKAPAATAASQLIEMIVEIESFRSELENEPQQRQQQQCLGPILVHCSAGLGRTGCYIAVSEGMQEFKEQNTVDVLAIVCRLRLDRGGLVQTTEQYQFVYHALYQFEKYLPPEAEKSKKSVLD